VIAVLVASAPASSTVFYMCNSTMAVCHHHSDRFILVLPFYYIGSAQTSVFAREKNKKMVLACTKKQF
jgi:hypothetical protein